ncbi:MAG: histidine kinase [Bacteroidota bacterium]
MKLPLSRHEWSLLIVFYAFMALNYYVVLYIDFGVIPHLEAVLFNYGFKALLSIPVFLLVRKYMSYMRWGKVLLIHFLFLIIFSVAWVKLYYAACDYWGIYRARDSKIVWDYYLTGVFYAIQFGGLHLYLYNLQIRETNQLMAQLSRLKSESELSALKSQLNPHFLYNAFNTISSAIPREAKPARRMVNILADIFRYQLRASRQNLVLIQDELLYIGRYLELEQERFGNRLAYRIEGESSLGNLKIPPTLLQPLVENSIKHGISPMVDGGEVIIQVTLSSTAVTFTISDTGAGVDDEDLTAIIGIGVGLSNTNERLVKIYGAGLDIQHNVPRGLLVRFSVPLTE